MGVSRVGLGLVAGWLALGVGVPGCRGASSGGRGGGGTVGARRARGLGPGGGTGHTIWGGVATWNRPCIHMRKLGLLV